MIDTTNLVELHDTEETIRRHKRILEELFYLCINPTFEKTIVDARSSLTEMLPENYSSLTFPTDRTNALEVRNGHLAHNAEYWALQAHISMQHRYYHPSFTRNNFTNPLYLPNTNTPDECRFNILENILFFNDPITDRNPLLHFRNRSGQMELANNETYGPHILMRFDLGTTKMEMHNIIEKDFSETAELQVLDYGIPNSQYRIDPSLRVKAYIYEHFEEPPARISVSLETKGMVKPQDNYDYVRMHKQRMTQAMERFDMND